MQATPAPEHLYPFCDHRRLEQATHILPVFLLISLSLCPSRRPIVAFFAKNYLIHVFKHIDSAGDANNNICMS